ncbi:hypothetical protein [Kitasatospora sp. NPDC094016]|uniref:hypothetical protein n=1 Tax=Kitasatospora sp. NPDC094016 TaxID=3154986 RepID=UPI0033275113
MPRYLNSAEALLSYAIKPEPDPLAVSTDRDVVKGRLDITVTQGKDGPAYCEKLTVRIRIGAGANALTENRIELVSSVEGGTAPEQGGGWTPKDGYASGDWQVYEFTPNRPPLFDGWHLTLIISQIEVNKTPGNAEIEIIERSSPTDKDYTEKTTPATVPKFPSEFVFRDFHPEAITVDRGKHAVLEWEGSDAEYTMFWDQACCDVSSVRSWTTPEPLVSPTGFMLQAKVTTGGDTLVHTLTTVVMVSMPELDVSIIRANLAYTPHTHLRHAVLDITTGDWSVPAWTSVATTDPNPSLASFGGRLRCSYFDGELRRWAGWNGNGWEYEELALARRSRSAPAFTHFQGYLSCLHGDREDYLDVVHSADGGLTWTRVPGLERQREWASTSPLTVTWAVGLARFFLFRSSDDTIHQIGAGTAWSHSEFSNTASPFGVSGVLAADNVNAHFLLATENGSMYVHSTAAFDWGSPKQVADFRTVSRPSLLRVTDTLHCFFRDTSGIQSTTSTDKGESWSSTLLVPGTETSTRAPAVAEHDGYLHLVF